MSLRGMTACLFAVCTLLGVALAGEALASPSPMVDKINAVRAQHGLKALGYSRSLARSSRRYARYMVRRHRFSHASRIRASSRFAKLGEILARTPGALPDWERTLADWLASPSHRAVLLSSSYSLIGAGRARARSGGDSAAVVWAVQFGRY